MNVKQIPPKAVVFAAWLYILYGFLTAARIGTFNGGPPSSLGASFAWVLAFAYFVIVARLLYLGRNWVRWWVIALAVLAVVVGPWEIYRTQPAGEQIFLALQILINLALGVLLLLPASKRWFRPNNSFKPNPLRGSA